VGNAKLVLCVIRRKHSQSPRLNFLGAGLLAAKSLQVANSFPRPRRALACRSIQE